MEIKIFLQNFADLLEDTDESQVKAETAFRDLEEWDSMTALALIAMVDEEYDVKLTGDDIKTSVTLQDIFNKVSANL